ncbi:UNVERIFIED_CONTAM: Abietadienol/abietadienal oxidase [Sesamum latifolium]|uniref:Abietadienol/abietadienal oxidase n=1 Tax=Sesamum latifolium TaxID=2727402 RepID=A0AAW2UMS1_9LAMI
MTENLGTPWPYIISSLLLILFLANFFHHKTNKKNSATTKLPPGRRGWPIVGDSISWYNAVASSHPPSFVEQQVERFGKIFSCSLFGKWAVVSADPAFNRFVMQNEGKLFQSSYPKSFRDLVGKNGVITAQGDQQRKLHSIASNMMRLEKLKFHFLQDIQNVMKKMITDLHDNQVVLLQDVCRKVAINLMVNQLLGVSSESEVNEIAQLFSDFADGCLSVPINLPGFAYHKAMKARESIISKINRTMEIHRRKSSAAVAKTMLFAVYFLTQCPRAMKQLLDEQQSLRRESGEMLTWQDYKAMPFTQCVIDETLRLGGIAIWLMREAKEDVEYQGEEKLEEQSIFCTVRGWGSVLSGAELARLQIALFLHYFLTTFRWRQVKDDQMSFFPSARLVNGFQIQLTKLCNHSLTHIS